MYVTFVLELFDKADIINQEKKGNKQLIIIMETGVIFIVFILSLVSYTWINKYSRFFFYIFSYSWDKSFGILRATREKRREYKKKSIRYWIATFECHLL